MRFKFRIWHKGNRRFIDNSAGTHCFSHYMIDAFTGEVIDAVGCLGGEGDWRSLTKEPTYYMDKLEFIKESPFVIQQYTGIKDKNGKEIYEGDILDQILDNKPCYYVVEWGNFSEYCGFGLRALMKRDGSFRCTIHNFKMYLSEGFNIIGNVFENPELLIKDKNEH